MPSPTRSLITRRLLAATLGTALSLGMAGCSLVTEFDRTLIDSGAVDGREFDPDAGASDGSASDGSASDGSTPDGSTPDTSTEDASDTGASDADADIPDSETPDASDGGDAGDGGAVTCTQASECPNVSCKVKACTPGDAGASVCTYTDVVCTAFDGCHLAGVCNPTADGGGACTNPVAVGASCNSINLCITGATCNAQGLCTGTTKTCTTPGVCETAPGTCNPSTGACGYPAAQATTVCATNICATGQTCDGNRNCSVGSVCSDPTRPLCVAGVGCSAVPAATVIITEIAPLAASANETFVELYNPGSTGGSIAGFTLVNAAGDRAVIRAKTDLTGALETPVVLAPGTYQYGVPSTASSGTQAAADFVFVPVAPANDFVLAVAGDDLRLEATTNPSATNPLARLDYRPAPTGPGFATSLAGSAAVGAGELPGIAGRSVQLDVGSLTTANAANPARWCVPFRATDTRGALNESCTKFFINEVVRTTHDGTAGRRFVELAGPAGGSFAGLAIAVADAASGAQTSVLAATLTGGRMPLDGFYVLAGDAGGGASSLPAPVVDQVVAFPAPSPSFGLQIRRSNVVVDGVGINAVLGTPNTAGLGTPIVEPTSPGLTLSLARSATSANTDDNAADFHVDPTPTPGRASDAVSPQILSLTPDDGLAIASTLVTFDTVDVPTPVLAQLGGVNATGCAISALKDDGRSGAFIQCTAQPSGSGAFRQNARLELPAFLTGFPNAPFVTVANGWTYTAVANGTGALPPGGGGTEVAFCNVQSPVAMNVASGAVSPAIFGRFRNLVPAYTPGALLPARLEVGVGPATSDPTTASSYDFFSASRNAAFVSASTDEYQGTVVAPQGASGTIFRVVYRVSVDDGITWTYCDTGGAGSGDATFPADGFDAANAATLTIP